jgi:hypothetical protein
LIPILVPFLRAALPERTMLAVERTYHHKTRPKPQITIENELRVDRGL